MKQNKSIVVLGVLAAISAGIAVYGGMLGNEPMLGAGVAVGFLSLLMMPAFHNRAQKIRKIREKENPFIYWEYADDEVEDIAEEQRRVVRKKSVWLSVLISICMAIIFLPFYLISLQENSELPPILPIALICVLLPWLSVLLAPSVAVGKIRVRPCVSIVGNDYVLVANRYLGVNDRWQLKAGKFRLEESTSGAMAKLSVQYSFRAMKSMGIFHLWVNIPVPPGQGAGGKGAGWVRKLFFRKQPGGV